MRRRVRAAILPAAAVMALSACGSGSPTADDPGSALQDAVDEMAQWDGVALDARLDTTVDSLLALDEEAELDPSMAEAIVDSELSVRAFSGEDADSSADDETDLRAHFGDVEVLHLIGRHEELYVRSDLEDLIERFGEEQELAEFRSGLAEAEAMGLSFLTDLREGRWLHLQGMEELSEFSAGMAQSGTSTTPSPEELADVREQLAGSLQRFLDDDVTSTFVGAEDPGDHVRLEASGEALKNLYFEMMEASMAAAGSSQAAMLEGMLSDLESEAAADDSASSFTMPVDVWIADGAISRIAVDFVALEEANPQLDGEGTPDGVERFAVQVDFAPYDGGVDVPADAVEVDVFELLGQMVGGGATGPAAFEDPTA